MLAAKFFLECAQLIAQNEVRPMDHAIQIRAPLTRSRTQDRPEIGLRDSYLGDVHAGALRASPSVSVRGVSAADGASTNRNHKRTSWLNVTASDRSRKNCDRPCSRG